MGHKDNPGITLNLERAEGGKCDGVSFEFADDSRTSTLLAYLRKREACAATTLPIQLADGQSVEALTYIYEGPNLIDPATTIAPRAALVGKASGTSGSAIDYVRRNFEGLRAAGLEDKAVTELWEAVLALERE